MGDHPLDPVRVELTMALARDLGVLDRPGVVLERAEAATDAMLATVHDPDYIAVVKAASTGRRISMMAWAPRTTRPSPACTRRAP